MATNLQYFLEWYKENWILGLVTLVIICLTIASSMGSIGAALSRKED